MPYYWSTMASLVNIRLSFRVDEPPNDQPNYPLMGSLEYPASQRNGHGLVQVRAIPQLIIASLVYHVFALDWWNKLLGTHYSSTVFMTLQPSITIKSCKFYFTRWSLAYYSNRLSAIYKKRTTTYRRCVSKKLSYYPSHIIPSLTRT